jgi:two-component system, LytTR family, sensor kinase
LCPAHPGTLDRPRFSHPGVKPPHTGYNSSMPARKTKIRALLRDYVVSIAVWLPLSLLATWQAYEADRDLNLPSNLRHLALAYAARYLSIALLTPPIFYCVGRWPIRTGAVVRRTLGYALGYAPFLLAFGLIRWSVLPVWIDSMGTWGPRTLQSLQSIMFDKFADLLILYLTVVIVAHAYAYFISARRQEIERLQLRQSLAHSELQALRAQLHPHFLFNTLQGISTLIPRDQATAQRMVLTLAGLLRTVLKHGSTDIVTFREELEFVRAYLNLEKLRLDTRLEVRWHIAPEADAALIPQLLLQPLIENALQHGIANSIGGGWISVAANVSGGRLIVRITNSIAGASAGGMGLGLENVRARLKWMFADDARFEFSLFTEPPRAVAVLELPAFTTTVAERSTDIPAERSTDIAVMGEQQCEY